MPRYWHVFLLFLALALNVQSQPLLSRACFTLVAEPTNIKDWKTAIVGKKVGFIEPNTEKAYVTYPAADNADCGSKIKLPPLNREIYPGDAVTADFIPDRLNINLDKDSVVTDVSLG